MTTIELRYRAGDKITKRVLFSGLSLANGRPQGRVVDHKGKSLGVRSFTDFEVEAWEKRTPGQKLIEMGFHEPYESVHDEVIRLGLRRSSAPSGISGRGDYHYKVVGEIPVRYMMRLPFQPPRYSGKCY